MCNLPLLAIVCDLNLYSHSVLYVYNNNNSDLSVIIILSLVILFPYIVESVYCTVTVNRLAY